MNVQNHTIDTYLRDLRSALKGADRAVVQDALADAEEHLRTAVERERDGAGDPADGHVLAGIIRDYGTPGEVAEAYRNWEPTRPPMLAPLPVDPDERSEPRPRGFRGFFGVYADPRAWGGLVYMLISLITGTLYFSWAVTAVSTSLGVMILIIGIPVTILLLLSTRGMTFLEGRLVEALLGERMPRRPVFTDNSLGWTERLKQVLLGKSTWLGLLYMVLMLPLGVIYFSVTVTLISLSLAFFVTPVLTVLFDLPIMVLNGDPAFYLPDYLSPLVCIAGVLLGTLTLHLARWTGKVHGKLAKALLVSD